MAEPFVVLDSDDENSASSSKEQGNPDRDQMECPICLQTCIHPVRLPCGHIFCFLCVKGVANKNRRCAMCRREIPVEFLDQPQLVYQIEDTHPTTDDGYQWFYEGRNGWWQYDERTSQEIEDAYKRPDKLCTILVAGYVYIVDFETMLQQRQNDPSRKRQVKRDLATTAKKGVAGLRIDGTADPAETSSTGSRSQLPAGVANNLISTIAATDAAIRIASDIIDSTLAHASSDSVGVDPGASSTAAGGAAVPLAASSSNSSGGSSVSRRLDLLHEVEETLNLSTASNASDSSSSSSSNSARMDFFSQTIEEFRSLALTNIATTDSESDDDDDADGAPNTESPPHTETELF